MNKNTGDGELLKYFWPFPYPKHKPPIEVIFSNGVPQSDDPDHMVFQTPYNTFELAIKKYAAQEANKAQIASQHKTCQNIRAWLSSKDNDWSKEAIYRIVDIVEARIEQEPDVIADNSASVIQNKLEGLQ